jgi:hypothetical protein
MDIFQKMNENQFNPAQFQCRVIPRINYAPFPNMNVTSIDIINGQCAEIDFSLTYTNGVLVIRILEKL